MFQIPNPRQSGASAIEVIAFIFLVIVLLWAFGVIR